MLDPTDDLYLVSGTLVVRREVRQNLVPAPVHVTEIDKQRAHNLYDKRFQLYETSSILFVEFSTVINVVLYFEICKLYW